MKPEMSVSSSVATLEESNSSPKSEIKCSNCGSSFLYAFLLNDHVRKAHTAKIYECQETNCSKKFASIAGLHMHIQMRHQQGTRLPCVSLACGHTFENYEQFNSHRLRYHCESQKFYGCPLERYGCYFAAISSKVLAKHFVRDHPGLNPICPIVNCGMVCRSIYQLVEHAKGHAEKETKVVVKPVKVKQEKPKKETETKTPYNCPIGKCDRKYCSASSLKRHVNRTHDQNMDKESLLQAVNQVINDVQEKKKKKKVVKKKKKIVKVDEPQVAEADSATEQVKFQVVGSTTGQEPSGVAIMIPEGSIIPKSLVDWLLANKIEEQIGNDFSTSSNSNDTTSVIIGNHMNNSNSSDMLILGNAMPLDQMDTTTSIASG